MKQLTSAQSPYADDEYSIYVYHYPEDIEDGHTDWERKAVTHCIQDAINQGQILFDSKSFKKVEIKKKYYDARYDRVIDATYKVFQDKKRVSRRSGVWSLFALSCFAGFGIIVLPFITAF